MNYDIGDLVYDGQTLGMIIEIKHSNVIVEWFANRGSIEHYHDIAANWRLQHWRKLAGELLHETRTKI